MKQTNYLNSLSTLLAVLGIILFAYSAILGTLLIALALVCVGLWVISQRLEKIEQKIEMINNHNIINDERLHNIEQNIENPRNKECPE